ncbi:MAG: hypothetical protein ACKV2U_14875 [Bryobacteraceae bacterium]
MTISRPTTKTLLPLLLLCSSIHAQRSDVEDSIRELYRQTLSALKLAKTDDDIRRVVDIMDVREWLSLDATGLPMSREQARSELKSLLALPPERRTPRMEILWIDSSAAATIVVLWVYNPMEIPDNEGRYGPRGEKRNVLLGSLVRDTFARTDLGWRRIRHEKIIPNQILTVDGRSLISPPLDSSRAISTGPN